MAYVGEQETRLLDDAVCADTPSWTVVAGAGDQPVLHRRWQHTRRGGRGRGGLVLVVLGWYPALLTVGTEPYRPHVARRALRRLVSAVRQAGGRTVPDSDIEAYVSACQARWAAVVAAQRTITAARSQLASRPCAACAVESAAADHRCRGCGHQFTIEDDLRRDTRAREVTAAVARAEAEVAGLARGAGLLDGEPDRKGVVG